MKKKRKLKKKFIVFFFLYFAFFTSFFIYKSFSKYSTNINKTADVDVAKWDVSANIPDASFSVTPNGNHSYNITVTNNSDVALTYNIQVNNVSKNSVISLDGKKFSDSGNSFTFKNVGTINANDSNKTREHELIFISNPDVTEYNNRQVTISVIFTQKNPTS